MLHTTATMKALVLTGPSTFEYRTDYRQPTPAAGEVLIRVRAVGICGSDVHGMTGSTGRRIPPVVMGHEASGEVVKVGPGVDSAWVGKRVTFDSTIFCGRCEYCMSGRRNLCTSRRVLGVSCADYRQDGAMAEYAVVAAQGLYELPAELDFDYAAMMEPAGVSAHAVELAGVKLGHTVAVMGCGVIGLLAVQFAKIRGASRVIAYDTNAARLAVAAQTGADQTVLVDPAAPPFAIPGMPAAAAAPGGAPAKTSPLTHPPVDIVIEAVGIDSTIANSIAMTRRGGTVVLVGNLKPSITFPLQSVVVNEIAVRGSCAIAGEYRAALDLTGAKRLNLEPLISARAPLSAGSEWFHRLHDTPADLLKVILVPPQD